MRISTLPATALPLCLARIVSFTRVSFLTWRVPERLTESFGLIFFVRFFRTEAAATGAAARGAACTGAAATGAAEAAGTARATETAIAATVRAVRRTRFWARAGRAELLVIELPQVRLRGELSGSGRGSPGRTSS